jgi:hypothetical protein
MAEHRDIQNRLPDLSDPSLRHEHDDINVWAVGKVGIVLILTTIAALFLMFGMFRYFQVRENALQVPSTVTAAPNPNNLPPEPRVLFNEHEHDNLQEIQANEQRELNDYGWVDKAHGVVRLPVDRAMDLILQRGLPARLQPGQAVERQPGVGKQK